MYQEHNVKSLDYPHNLDAFEFDDHIVCDWKVLRAQLLHQWQRLTATEIDGAGPNRIRIAHLIGRKYGIPTLSIESYLRNFERTMPL